MEMTTVGIVLGVTLGVALLFAQLQLFKISDTLKEILQEVRVNHFMNELRADNPLARQQAIAALCAILQNKRLPSRSMIVAALTACGPDAKVAVPALRELLEDKDELLWQEAAEAIKHIDPDEFAKLTKAK